MGDLLEDIARFARYQILPHAGGWVDQEPRFMAALTIADQVRTEVAETLRQIEGSRHAAHG